MQLTKLRGVLGYIVARLREPSSYAGLAIFVGLFGIDAETFERLTTNIYAIIAGIGAVVAIVAPSHTPADKPELPEV